MATTPHTPLPSPQAALLDPAPANARLHHGPREAGGQDDGLAGAAGQPAGTRPVGMRHVQAAISAHPDRDEDERLVMPSGDPHTDSQPPEDTRPATAAATTDNDEPCAQQDTNDDDEQRCAAPLRTGTEAATGAAGTSLLPTAAGLLILAAVTAVGAGKSYAASHAGAPARDGQSGNPTGAADALAEAGADTGAGAGANRPGGTSGNGTTAGSAVPGSPAATVPAAGGSGQAGTATPGSHAGGAGAQAGAGPGSGTDAPGGKTGSTPAAMASQDGAGTGNPPGQQSPALPPATPPGTTPAPLPVQVAHDGELRFDTALFDGHDPTLKARFVRISGIQDGDGQPLPAATGVLKVGDRIIRDGDVLSEEELGALTWHAALATGGAFSFTPVADALGSAIAGASTRQVTIDEHAPAPRYDKPEEPVAVAPDTPRVAIPAAMLTGTGAQPTYIKVLDISDTQQAGVRSDGLKLEMPFGVISVREGQVLDASLLGKLSWDVDALARGGITFIPVRNEAGDELLGAQAHRLNIETTTPPPVQLAPPDPGPPTMTRQTRTETQQLQGAKLFQAGNGDGSLPAFTRFTDIEVVPDRWAEHRYVRVHGDSVTAYTVIQGGPDGVSRQEAQRMSDALGGRLLQISDPQELDWLNAELTGRLGPDGGPLSAGVQRGVWMHPPSALHLPDARNSQVLTEDAGTGKLILKPASSANLLLSGFVVEHDGYTATRDAFFYYAGSNADGSDIVSTIRPGSVVSGDGLSYSAWSGRFNEGGRVRYVPVTDAEGNTPTDGAQEKTVVIAGLASPDFQGVGENAISALKPSLFDDSIRDKDTPDFIRITRISPITDDYTVVQHGNSAYVLIETPDGITREAARAAAQAMGGKLLELNDADEAALLNSHFSDSLPQQGMTSASPATNVMPGTWIGEVAGTMTEAAGKQAVHLNPEDDTLKYLDVDTSSARLSGYLVEFDNPDARQHALLLAGNDTDASLTPVEEGRILSAEELGRLRWDGLFNNGGSIRFIEVRSGSDGTPAEGAREKYVHIVERPQPLNLKTLLAVGKDMTSSLLDAEADDPLPLPGNAAPASVAAMMDTASQTLDSLLAQAMLPLS